MSDVFLEHYPTLSRRERAQMFEILHMLVHDMEMLLRQVMSEHLAQLDDVPRALAMLLANDEIEVAFPILSLSTVLLDEDLVEIIRNRSVEHQLAVTKRPSISETVSDALVETGVEGVVASLLANAKAAISSATFTYLAEESKRVTAYQEPLLRREDLEPDLAKRMFAWVSTALRQFVLENYEIDPAYVDEIIERSILDELGSAGTSAGRPGARDKLADALKKEGQLTPEIMVQALQDGEVQLFVAMFRQLTGIPEKVVESMVFDYDGLGLAIACKAANLGKLNFSSIFACCRKAREGGDKGLRQEVRRLLALYDRMSHAAAEVVVKRWRQKIGYQAAIRELELS